MDDIPPPVEVDTFHFPPMMGLLYYFDAAGVRRYYGAHHDVRNRVKDMLSAMIFLKEMHEKGFQGDVSAGQPKLKKEQDDG